MSDRKSDAALERRIAAALDAESRNLDRRMQRRLDAARDRALSQAPRTTFASWLVPAVAGAAAVTAVTAVLVIAPTGDSPESPAPHTDDLDLLTREEFELFIEEPAFYAWVAQGAPPVEDGEEES